MKKKVIKEKPAKKEVKKKEVVVTFEDKKISEPTKEILDLTRRLVDLETRYEEASKMKTQLYDARAKLQAELINKMQENNLESFRSSEFGLIYSYNHFWGKIIDLKAAEEWLLENGLHDEVLKLEARTARLNELLKKRLEDGLSVPPGMDYTVSKKIGHRTS